MIADLREQKGFEHIIFVMTLLLVLGLFLTGCGEIVDVEGIGAGGGGSNSLMLSWNPPASNDDGSALEDLAGYKLYYGTLPGQYSRVINVGNYTSAVIGGLGSGTYYLAVTAYNIYGNESRHSNEINYTFN